LVFDAAARPEAIFQASENVDAAISLRAIPQPESARKPHEPGSAGAERGLPSGNFELGPDLGEHRLIRRMGPYRQPV